jgi:CDP-diacylglycerol--serine O-phosphatidyltransferase
MPKQIIERIRNPESGCFPLAKILPSLVTLASLCIALTAIRHSLLGNFSQASGLLILAGVMDGIDGRLARFLNSSSNFGAQLDSLVDFVSFGVAPGFVIYFWVGALGGVKGFDWAMVLFFAVCAAIRLARFNATSGDKELNPVLEKYFFVGIPAPVGAGMAMLPIFLFFEFGAGFYSNPIFIVIFTVILALLMASRVPTISIKKIPIRNEYASLTLLVLGSMIIGLIIEPWMTLAIIGVSYIISVFATVIWYNKIVRK